MSETDARDDAVPQTGGDVFEKLTRVRAGDSLTLTVRSPEGRTTVIPDVVITEPYFEAFDSAGELDHKLNVISAREADELLGQKIQSETGYLSASRRVNDRSWTDVTLAMWTPVGDDHEITMDSYATIGTVVDVAVGNDDDSRELVTDGGRDELELKKQEAKKFWNRYEIPFEHDVAIKVRRSGLLRGSSGNGHASDTVYHLHVKEHFKDGRLSRSSDSYLCDKDSFVGFDGREERNRAESGSYVPKITCQTCLNRMERWKLSRDELTEVEQ